jgi:micrococcal nuclease
MTRITTALRYVVTSFLIMVLMTFISQYSDLAHTETDETNTNTLGASVEATSSATYTPQTGSYLVTKVRDGDTIEINYNGKTEAVRLVGINTPETVDPRRPVQCFGKEASNKLKALLTQKAVSLETDATQSDRDRYGRLLRFVFLDGQDVGLIMLKEGYAQESLYSSVPHLYRDLYLTAQKEAQDNERGLWSPDACPMPSPKPTASSSF